MAYQFGYSHGVAGGETYNLNAALEQPSPSRFSPPRG
jgi:hypothetical protein